MQIVIDISEEIKAIIDKNGTNEIVTETLWQAVKNGTPLDKIRAEIEELEEGISSYHNDRPWVFKDEVLQIIDKYKAESEVQE